MTRKIVSEMTYNVSMGTLNPTIPYHHSTARTSVKLEVVPKAHGSAIVCAHRNAILRAIFKNIFGAFYMG